jgi:thiamine biosynthesis protein ThiI
MADAVAYRTLVLRMGEIWLKGRNRNTFKRRLQRNLSASLRAEIPNAVVLLEHARVVVHVPDPARVSRAIQICCDTPGITWVSPALPVDPTIESMQATALDLAQHAWQGATGSFKVKTRRSDKQFPIKSPEVDRQVGGPIAAALGLTVDLKQPDRTVGIDITRAGCHVYVERHKGIGGLPVGTVGRVMLLLSGGLDSPVAGYFAQRRGCELEAVYFHSPPFISEASKDKVIDLARRLAPRQGSLRLHVVPFAPIQLAIRDAGGGRLTVVLYRRFMYRIAARLAQRFKASALCTGENLAQVASQTPENLAVVNEAASVLTLRPLLCADKEEIIDVARRIGTYTTSIQPFDDCCTLFLPEHPATRAPLGPVLGREARLDVAGLMDAALEGVETIKLGAVSAS